MITKDFGRTGQQRRVLKPIWQKKVIASLLISLLKIPNSIAVGHESERFHQKLWCTEGKTEFVLSDRSRVDCVTDNYVIEFDFAKKWAEAIGQALFYSAMTQKQAGIVLIMDPTDELDSIYFDRLSIAIEDHCLPITVWAMPLIYKKDQ